MSTAMAICSAARSYTASRTQTVSASTRCETQAPFAMNSSAARTCLASSRTTSRTTTLVSTARMPFANVFSDRDLHIRRGSLFPLFHKEGVVNVLGAEPPGPTDDHSTLMLVPFQHRSLPDAKLLANLGRHRA